MAVCRVRFDNRELLAPPFLRPLRNAAGGSMNAPFKPPIVNLALDAITLDVELQPRTIVDKETWEEYMNLLADGAEFPPVVVFHDDGGIYWLADGFHRWHAHKALGTVFEIRALVHPGTRLDALRFSLGANATHGKRRSPGDHRLAYQRACEHGLVGATDVVAIQALLRCTMQWAFKLTQTARADAAAARNALIAAASAAGQSNASIARDLGVHSTTIDRRVTSARINSLETQTPAPEPKPKHPAQVEYDEMTSVSGQLWGSLFHTLGAVNDMASAAELFTDDRYRRLDTAIGPRLTEAAARINEIHRRFFDD